jgi:succinate dehydrogenase/fumarate reductase-like Fe-S protein
MSAKNTALRTYPPPHEHKWVVYSTALAEVSLLVRCIECGALGSVRDPSEEEWFEGAAPAEQTYRVRMDGEVTRPSNELEWMIDGGLGVAPDLTPAPIIGYTWQPCPKGVDPAVRDRLRGAWPEISLRPRRPLW